MWLVLFSTEYTLELNSLLLEELSKLIENTVPQRFENISAALADSMHESSFLVNELYKRGLFIDGGTLLDIDRNRNPNMVDCVWFDQDILAQALKLKNGKGDNGSLSKTQIKKICGRYRIYKRYGESGRST
jgi:hypothetical protein